jgi:pantoate--beta-alanine ligase
MTALSTLPKLVTTIDDLRRSVADARRAGKRIGIVPTMGALHEGHLSLVRASKAECGFTVVSIFVNPTQFSPGEDLDKYPRSLDADLARLGACQADVAFVPDNSQVYRDGHSTWVDVEGLTRRWEGECRPNHFRGVTTVVLKLLNMAVPDVAFFGQKDYQQAAVIRRMVADLDVPVAIRVCPTVREPDGLAMSSRNVYLSPEARGRAMVLWQSLCLARELVAEGERDAATVARRMREMIVAVPGTRIDYVALADPDTLEPVEQIDRATLAAVAVKIENTRLIDNEILNP